MKFFFDNCLPPRTARALNALDVDNDIVHLKDRFAPDTGDVEWIEQLGRERNWIIVSMDQIYRADQQRKALIDARFISIFLKSGWNQPLWLQASRFFAWWPTLVEKVARASQGDCFRVPFKGQKIEKFRLDP